MRWILAAAAVLAACGPPDEDGVDTRRDAIVRGATVYGDSAVFELLISGTDGAFRCTGSLIAPHTILTAAHCLATSDGSAPRVLARNDVLGSRTPGWGQVESVGVVIHPSYVDGAFEAGFDLALIQLAREPFAPTLPWNTEPIDELDNKFRPARLVGYGITNFGLSDSGARRSVVAPLQRVEGALLSMSGALGTCQGDSGGPALLPFAGVERIIGITSFGFECGPGRYTRVDTYRDFIAAQVGAFEEARCPVGPSSGCVGLTCRTEDLTCACVEDGACSPSCTGAVADPDCLSSCAADGVCSNAACATPDPDCQGVGLPCGRDGHCASRRCIASEQHPQAYCSLSCATGADCPPGFSCTGGACTFTVLPEVALDAACTPGASWCAGSPKVSCTTAPGEDDTRCREECFDDRDCSGGFTCTVATFDARSVGVCKKDVSFKRLGREALPAAGCGAAPSPSLGVLGLAVALWRRARRARSPSLGTERRLTRSIGSN